MEPAIFMKSDSPCNNRILLLLNFGIILFFFFFIQTDCMAQVTPFKKSVLDSLKANEFNGSFSYALNLGQDGTSTFTTNTDVGILYSNRRSDYELVGNGYRNRFEANSISNRLFVLAKVAMFSHIMEQIIIRIVHIFNHPMKHMFIHLMEQITVKMKSLFIRF